MVQPLCVVALSGKDSVVTLLTTAFGAYGLQRHYLATCRQREPLPQVEDEAASTVEERKCVCRTLTVK